MTTDFTPRQAMGVIDGPVVLLTTAANGKRNVMAANMVMGTSLNPTLVAVSVSPTSFSHRLIEESGEFCLNIAGPDQLNLVEQVGGDSGSEMDKFETFGIETTRPERIKAPLINGCPASIECVVTESWQTGEHTLYLGHVVALHRREGTPLVLYRGDYYELGNRLGTFFKKAA
ncbi:MAG: flavin reductase family protein [Candidatus Aquicultorales bacterium]